MSVYSYPESKVIDEIIFKKTANGAIRAYLHARDGVDAATAQEVMQRLKARDFDYIPFTLDGKPTIEVRGFKQEADLVGLLDKNAWIQGKPTIALDKEDHIGWVDWFKKRSLQLSGIAMGIADTGFVIYGVKEAKLHKQINPHHRRDFSEALAGFCYLGGSSVLTAYGRNDQSGIQVRELAALILKNAQERGLVTEGSAAATLSVPRQEGILKKVDNFFREHPSEIGNMMYFSAGALIAQSAFRNRVLAKPRPEMTAKQIHERRLGGWGDTALGLTTVGSALLATLGKEKAHDPDEPVKHGISAFTDWLWRNPLAMASYGYIGSTLCHAFTTYKERKEAIRAAKDMSLTANERFFASEKTKAVPWRVLFIGATLVGEFLLSISSKGHGEGVASDQSVDTSAIAVAADMIVKQPRHMQDDLIDYMAKFLGQSQVLAIKDEEAVDLLRKQVEGLRGNPWAKAEAEGGKARPAAAPAAEKPGIPAWQAKIASSQPALAAHGASPASL